MKSMATPHFTPIEEGNEDVDFCEEMSSFRETPKIRDGDFKHQSTPLHKDKCSSRKRQEDRAAVAAAVSCNKCRPGNREKTSVVPLENNGVSPNGLFKSILASLALKKSPKSSLGGGAAVSGEEHLKIAVAELSNKLIHVSRNRDEAVLEASKLKFSMGELEKKMNKLEIYCHGLKSELENCSNGSNDKSPTRVNYQSIKVGDQEKVVGHFLVMVSETRSSVRVLSRALSIQMRQMGGKVYDRVSLMLLQPYDIKISFTRNPRGMLFYLEALLNKVFFQDFESSGFEKGAANSILNPMDRCEANLASFSRLQELTWEEVLSKGTRHYSEDFSKFCDRKMSEIVSILGWNRAWPEPLLQAFFRASRAAWLVHLLANSIHPGLPIFRVENGAGFDPIYMEDMGGDKAKRLIPNTVRIMVAPGFYVYDSVVKSKVICRYHNNPNMNDLTQSPPL